MIHYIYKIHFLCGFPSGRYYIGKRTYKGSNLKNDDYTGSGNFCKEYFYKYKKLEGVTYIKEILEINPSWKVNRIRESIIISNLYKTDPLCMNLVAGGCGGDSSDVTDKEVIAYDELGKEVCKYKSVKNAAKSIGLKSYTSILNCCENRCLNKLSGGFLWRFSDDPILDSEIKNINVRHKSVLQYDLDGTFIKEWNNIMSASVALNIESTSITACCKKKRRNSAGGFVWRYKKNPLKPNEIKSLKFNKIVKILKYDLNDNLVAEYDSLSSAADSVNGKWQSIQRVCDGKRNTSYGYKWKRKGAPDRYYDKTEKRINKFAKKVDQFDLNGNLIQSFDSIRIACEQLNAKKSEEIVRACCNGKCNTALGYKWQWNDNEVF